jgi:plasmid stabilization system protein ParE
MSLPIFYTPRSKETLSSVYLFIEAKFGIRSAAAFIAKTEKTINTIATQPKAILNTSQRRKPNRSVC